MSWNCSIRNGPEVSSIRMVEDCPEARPESAQKRAVARTLLDEESMIKRRDGTEREPPGGRKTSADVPRRMLPAGSRIGKLRRARRR
jgi:hypothetical protein